jgi:fructose-bisphosphate aldolase class I
MTTDSLAHTAHQLVAPGRGILAADESTGTMTKRLASIGLESTPENRLHFRNLLFSTEGAAEHISGVILYDETLRQQGPDGSPIPEYLRERGILPGIKVDTGAKPLAFHEGEKVTEGLDGLRERIAEYASLGARFAKWRAVITIGADIPSRTCIEVNAHALARYAALCQEGGLVPIVEPEVLMDGDHDQARCFDVTSHALDAVFDALFAQGVHLDGMLLKPNMVISGTDCPDRAGVERVASETLRCFRRHVPAAVPGIVFLSGGQGPQEATAHLDAMNRLGDQPWRLSFSYGRALQQTALSAWMGRTENEGATQAAFAKRARLNGAAARGCYEASMESA